MEYDNTIYGLLSGKDLYKLYSLYYKIFSLIDNNGGKVYFENEREYRYFYTLLKEANELADGILVLMERILESWLTDHVSCNISEYYGLHMLSKLYELLVEVIGVDKDEVLSFIAENFSLKYDSNMQYWDDMPEGQDGANYLLEEDIIDGAFDIDNHKLESIYYNINLRLKDIPKLMPKESGLLFQKYMPQILSWIKNNMGGEFRAIHEALFEIKNILQNKDGVNITQKMGAIDRIKDIQHSMGGVFGVSANLEQDVLSNFVEEIPEELREDYYPYSIQNKFFEYLTHGGFEDKWREQMESYSQKNINWYKIAISEADFYDFYAISDFSEEDFSNNPKLLMQVIDHLNYIREYYLRYLTKEIADELLDGAQGAILWWSWEDCISGDVGEEKKKIADLAEKIRSFNNIAPRDFKEAMHYFGNEHFKDEYLWISDYGGPAWRDITKWTQKLYETQIFYDKSTKRVFDRIYKLIMIIDTIHSLEHNTNNVLVDLPEGEKEWMQKAFEIVKHSEFPAYFSNKMSKIEFQEEILRNKMLSQREVDKFNKGPYRKIFQEFINKIERGEPIYNNLHFMTLLEKADTIEIEVFFDVMRNKAKLVYDKLGAFRFGFMLGYLLKNPKFYTEEFLKKGLLTFNDNDTRRAYIRHIKNSKTSPRNILSILDKIDRGE